MTDQEPTKICVVCGDKAFGYNFCAIVCESCKAFFRRNALKMDEMQCHYNENCQINSVTRKVCRKCRLNKCFAIGMKKDYILNEEEKNLRKAKIEANRKKRTNNKNCHKECDSTLNLSTNELILTDNDSTNRTDIISKILDNNVSEEEINTQIMEIENSVESSDWDTVSEDVYEKMVDFELAVIPIARPITDCYTFNESEGNKLSELLNATQCLKFKNFTITSESINFSEAIQVMAIKTDQEIRKIIKMAKDLSSFRNMCENDQITLLKYGCIEIVCLGSVEVYNEESDALEITTDDVNATLMKLNLLKDSKVNIYYSHKRFLQNMVGEYDMDNNILDLLMAIILFNPERPNLIHRELIKLQRHIYMHLLKRYLQLRYRSNCESETRLLRLMNSLKDLDVLDREYHRFYSIEKPQSYPPLLKEIYDTTTPPSLT